MAREKPTKGGNESLFTAGGRLCVPNSLRDELMTEVHQNDAVGHRGATFMLLRSGDGSGSGGGGPALAARDGERRWPPAHPA